MTWLGTSVLPIDWEEKTSGAGEYTSDQTPEGTLFAKILRSPHPFARIISVDKQAALALPGVHAVITADDFDPDRRYIHAGEPFSDREYLARKVVRYVGEEVAAVAAESDEIALAALDLIEVTYRPLRAPLTMAQARSPLSRKLHRRTSGLRNVSLHDIGHWGNVDRGRAESRATVEGSFWYPRVNHVCMEPGTTLAVWDHDQETMRLTTSTQAPYFVAKEVAHALGLSTEQVVCTDVLVGGSFGSKSKVSEYEVLAARLALETKRPVLVALDRMEDMASTKPRHAFETRLRVHADSTGRLCLFEGDFDVDNGAYNHYGPVVMPVGIKTLGSIYRPDAASWDARLVDTAQVPGGQFRGYGMPQVAFALECLVDEMAALRREDPIQYRIQNSNPPHSVTLSGSRLGSARLAECLTAVRDSIDWIDKRRDPAPFRGLGVAAAMHGSGSHALHPDANRSEAKLTIDTHGRVELLFGGDAGTGQRTILAQVVAQELGMSPDQVGVVMGDTQRAPFELGAWSSRGTHMGGHAVRQCARELAARLRQIAAQQLNCEPNSIRLVNGTAQSERLQIPLSRLVAADPATREGLLEVETAYVDTRMEPRQADGTPSNLSASYTFAAHAIEIEVDPYTGEINLVDYVAAHDIGRALNPVMARGQIAGGVVQGLGAALYEELETARGRTHNATIGQYGVPRAGDMVDVRTILIEGPEPAGPYDAKSVGEIGIIPPAPALANALFDATGVRFRSLPITPDKVLTALRARHGEPARKFHVWRRPSRWQSEIARKAYPLGLEYVLDRFGTQLSPPRPRRQIESLLQPETVDDALSRVQPGAALVAGGTDLHVQRAQGLANPVHLISVTSVRELNALRRQQNGDIFIGAGRRLADLLRDEEIAPALMRDAIDTIASAQIREAATVGGNLLQAKRCWFYRSGFDCYKRGGPTCPCYAVGGDHRFYHAAIGADRCQAVTPSDLATVLTALDARVHLEQRESQRVPSVEQFFTGPGEVDLRAEEMLVGVSMSGQAAADPGVFRKVRLWEGDFALVSIALRLNATPDGEVADARLVFGAIAPTPWRARLTESALVGMRFGRFDVESAIAALNRDLNSAAHPLENNGWKLDAAVGLLRGELERLGAGVT